MPTGMALATYSPDLNTNESSDLSKTQYVQGHYGRQPRTWNNGMARGGKVHVADDLDMMRHEVHMAKGGLNEIIPMLARVAAKKPEEIKAIAERMAPQVVGEKFVRGSSGNTSVAGKSQKQFQREKELPIDIRPDKELPKPEIVDLAKHKGKVMVGIAGDPTMSAHTLHSVGDVNLESPAPQHGGPFYGLDKDVFWASGLSQANNAQRVAREASQSYNAPVIGNYMKMGPDSYYYAQHLADANLQAIDPTKMTDAQKALLNADIRAGGPMSKNKPIPYFDTFENKGDAYMQMQMNPALRKHFNWLVMKPTSAEKYGIPSGLDIAHAITVPKLANLETGVTGASMGEMKPFDPLTLSSHPTYSHDIPGQFLGSSKYPIPYELMFPDSLETVKNNPIQAPQEFGSLKMIGPRQIIDQQMIDEIGQYQDAMKSLTGKKKGGKVNVSNDPDMMRHELKTRG